MVGGFMVVNVMNFMMFFDSLWEYIMDFIDDFIWFFDKMCGYFEELEWVVYFENDLNYGYDGYIIVSSYFLFKVIYVD